MAAENKRVKPEAVRDEKHKIMFDQVVAKAGEGQIHFWRRRENCKSRQGLGPRRQGLCLPGHRAEGQVLGLGQCQSHLSNTETELKLLANTYLENCVLLANT